MVTAVARTPCRSPLPSSAAAISHHHPVQVVARIRQIPPHTPSSPSLLTPLPDGHTLRLTSPDLTCRDFTLDGISSAHLENLHSFYHKFLHSRVHGVTLGGRSTVIMYGPTGSGKSHTMFGSAREPGIAYRALQQIMGISTLDGTRSDGGDGGNSVKVSILEIYNEEVFDLLASHSATTGAAGSWKASPRASPTRARLEVMGRKVKNATSITGFDPEKVAREIATVEKRRVVKSTSCNDRSSRSHCMVIVDVPAVGGRLMLVDMAGSENIDQAGPGIETKLQARFLHCLVED